MGFKIPHYLDSSTSNSEPPVKQARTQAEQVPDTETARSGGSEQAPVQAAAAPVTTDTANTLLTPDGRPAPAGYESEFHGWYLRWKELNGEKSVSAELVIATGQVRRLIVKEETRKAEEKAEEQARVANEKARAANEKARTAEEIAGLESQRKACIEARSELLRMMPGTPNSSDFFIEAYKEQNARIKGIDDVLCHLRAKRGVPTQPVTLTADQANNGASAIDKAIKHVEELLQFGSSKKGNLPYG
ncbi:hypothetical protein FBU59_002495 [Linderina macrospora]|uniref:Uncharacterized protein n=1 Tax=Linderina macrospora TaxID=4868 RepID=A0ACC1JB05_9FUNG|nr:hypothetical protein FBU59_002495 [Linderina macrospora]